MNRLVAWLQSWFLRRQLPLTDEEKRRERNLFIIAGFLFVTMVAGGFFILCHWGAVCVALTWALACMAAGGAFGFLFGIPKTIQGRRPAPTKDESENKSDAAEQNQYEVNTNLEQISDWLTKILVGLGLTQLEKLPGLVQSVAAFMAVSLGDANEGFAGAVIVYFTIIGFFFGYLLTRMFLGPAFADADRYRTIRKAVFGELRHAPEAVQLKALREGVGKAWLFSPRAEPQAGADDPQKGKWGGSPRRNDRVLKGTVTPEGTGGNLFKVLLTVESENPAQHPLTGTVVFHLHPSFTPSDVPVTVDAGGVARLERIAYGAFTVGAECDNGQTQLELDLATLPEAPAAFRAR
jgi:hypothetical protein